MVKCSSCGADGYEDEDKYCSSCGKELKKERSPFFDDIQEKYQNELEEELKGK